jgi:mRNA-degrading endonuclease toxin of MazEF toxin-antitoxin module
MEAPMPIRVRLLLSLVLLFACLATANNKKKDALPAEVLDARTVVVLVDPDASMSTSAPLANKTAQDDVEKALATWGRLKLVLIGGNNADLVITVRKGNGKIVQPTVSGEPTNDRPVVVVPSDNGIHIGVQQGRPPDSTQPPTQATAPGLGGEVGATEDTFLVYRGGSGSSPLERAPVWRYVAKNGLRSPDVPAVAEFRKAVEAALKQQQKTTKP